MNDVIPFVSGLTPLQADIWLRALRRAMPELGVRPLEQLSNAERTRVDVAVVANPRPADVTTLPNLVWVQSVWAGVDTLLDELPDASFEIVRLIDPELTRVMSEAVLAWTLYLHRDMPRYRHQQYLKQWREHDLKMAQDRAVAVLGLGQLGSAAATRLAEQDFAVYGWSRSPKTLRGVVTFSGASGLVEILERAQVVVVLLPLTPRTRGLLNTETLALLPHGASIVNFARGAIVDVQALITQLDSGHLDHAVLDVFTTEPLPRRSELWEHGKVTLLPHIAAPTNYDTAAAIVAKNIYRYRDDGLVPRSVNREVGY